MGRDKGEDPDARGINAYNRQHRGIYDAINERDAQGA